MDTLGNSHATWVRRVGGKRPLAIGRLYTTADRLNPHRIFVPFRWLVPGRYELHLMRYDIGYPVTLERAEDHPDSRAMVVKGHVPI
ncbi:MAG: hypothetical protein O2919_10075 [Chloroflexi bacterium]|nr:hypothetical protein [Chloroflexota bacterium]